MESTILSRPRWRDHGVRDVVEDRTIKTTFFEMATCLMLVGVIQLAACGDDGGSGDPGGGDGSADMGGSEDGSAGDSVEDGSGLDGSGLDGSGLDGSGLDGSGLDGSGLDGSGDQDAGVADSSDGSEGDLPGEDLADATSSDGTGDDSGSARDAGLDACPFESLELELIESILARLVGDADWTIRNTHRQERGFALSLLDSDATYAGNALLIESCSEAVDYIPSCAPNRGTGLTSCIRFGCEEADIGYAQVYFTDGSSEDPSSEYELSYEGDHGTVTYDPRPYRYWRADDTGSDTVVTCEVDHTITLDREAGASLDLSHVAAVTATGRDSAVVSIEVEVDFNMTVEAESLHAVVEIDGVGTMEGTISAGDLVLATIYGDPFDGHDDADAGGGGHESSVTWIEVCAE
jgi:hypothetical protein